MTISGKNFRIKTILAMLPDIVIAEAREETYRSALWEQMRCIAKNTALHGGSFIDRDYADIVGKKAVRKADTRSADDIVTDIKARLLED